ncbi:MAG: hypothetical protein H6706_08795 [Myxococcales bacterium]|nr:hypothetical protein [Myxococcales bacterium]
MTGSGRWWPWARPTPWAWPGTRWPGAARSRRRPGGPPRRARRAVPPDGRELRWSGPALALLDAGETIWRRDAATGLQAATWDGERVWAAGASGVWWWRPGPGAPVPMGQPPGLGPVARLFRDDALLWLVDASGRGLPVWPRGPWLVPAGPEGQVVAGDDRLHAPLGEATVEARLGAIGVALDGQGTPTPGAVQALVPLGEFLIVAAGEAVVVYRAEGGRLVEAGRRALPGPTVAMFLVGPDRLLLVGADYGFGELALTPSSGAPRTGHPAP